MTTYPYVEGGIEPTCCSVLSCHIADAIWVGYASIATAALVLGRQKVHHPVPKGLSKWTTHVGAHKVGYVAWDLCSTPERDNCRNMVRERVVRGKGEWIHIRGGPKAGARWWPWGEEGVGSSPMYFSRKPVVDLTEAPEFDKVDLKTKDKDIVLWVRKEREKERRRLEERLAEGEEQRERERRLAEEGSSGSNSSL